MKQNTASAIANCPECKERQIVQCYDTDQFDTAATFTQCPFCKAAHVAVPELITGKEGQPSRFSITLRPAHLSEVYRLAAMVGQGVKLTDKDFKGAVKDA